MKTRKSLCVLILVMLLSGCVNLSVDVSSYFEDIEKQLKPYIENISYKVENNLYTFTINDIQVEEATSDTSYNIVIKYDTNLDNKTVYSDNIIISFDLENKVIKKSSKGSNNFIYLLFCNLIKNLECEWDSNYINSNTASSVISIGKVIINDNFGVDQGSIVQYKSLYYGKNNSFLFTTEEINFTDQTLKQTIEVNIDKVEGNYKIFWYDDNLDNVSVLKEKKNEKNSYMNITDEIKTVELTKYLNELPFEYSNSKHEGSYLTKFEISTQRYHNKSFKVYDNKIVFSNVFVCEGKEHVDKVMNYIEQN